MRVVVTKVTADRGPVTGTYQLVIHEAEDRVAADAEQAMNTMAKMQGLNPHDMNKSVSPDALPQTVRDALQVWLMSAPTSNKTPLKGA